MPDEQLRLVASVTDQFTAPLRRLKGELQSVSSNPAARLIRKDWEGVGAEMRKVTGELRSGFQPVLSSVGLTSIGIGGAVAGIITSMKGFAVATREMGMFGRSVGMTTDQLNVLKSLGTKFGMEWEGTQSSLRTFADNMDDVRRRWGATYGSLRAMNLGELAEKLVSAPNMQAAVETSLEALKGIQNPSRRREVARLLFGADQWATVAAEMAPNALAEIRSKLMTISPEMEKAATDFVDSWNRMDGAVEKFKVRTLGPLLPEMARAIDLLSKPIGDVLKNEVDGLSKGLKDLLAELTAIKTWWESLEAGSRSFFGGERTGGAVRNGIMPEASIGETMSNAEISKRRLQMDQNRRSVDVQDEIINRKESRGEDATESRRKRDRLIDETKRLSDEIQALRRGGATVQQQSFGLGGGGAGLGGLIQNASFGGGGPGGGGFRFGQGEGFGAGSAARPGGGTRGGVRRGASADDGSAGDVGSASAPTGNGRGTKGAARTGDMMAWAMDQLRREGVPEKHLRQSAAHLVGQAHMESGLDPNKTHDGGTGYGIYGARDPKGWGDPSGRRTKMVKWLEANGYAPNSAEGQMRYMAIEAMRAKGYQSTRKILMGEGSGDIEQDTNAITRNFEAPKITNRRSGAVREAYRVGPSAQPAASASNSAFPPVRSREDLARAAGMADVNYPLGWGRRMDQQPIGGGDSMMGRAFGPGGVAAGGAAPLKAEGSVNIHLAPGMQDARAKVDYDGMFKDVQVTRGSQVA